MISQCNARPAALCAALLLLAAGCGGNAAPSNPAGAVPVVVSIPPQKWLVEQVGGGHVEVTVLLAPGDDPHTYQPTDAQISRVMRAPVYFRVGVPFENGSWFRAIAGSEKLDVVDMRQGIRLREIEADLYAHEPPPGEHASDHGDREHHAEHARHEHGDPHDHAGRDPHIWTSPRLLKTQARTVASTLAEVFPEHGDAFQRNLAALELKLDQLDAAIREKLAGCRGRAMFVFHPAWGYFADEYGLRQVAVELEGKEPTDRELTELQQLARREGIRVIFVQPQISGQSAEAIARVVGARVEVLDPLAEDLPAELLRAAEVLAESYREPASEPTETRGK